MNLMNKVISKKPNALSNDMRTRHLLILAGQSNRLRENASLVFNEAKDSVIGSLCRAIN